MNISTYEVAGLGNKVKKERERDTINIQQHPPRLQERKNDKEMMTKGVKFNFMIAKNLSKTM